MDISNAQRARVLVHALPYIQDYSWCDRNVAVAIDSTSTMIAL